MEVNLENIRKVLDSGSGQSLKNYLVFKLNELKSIDAIKEKDVATHQAIELKAQKRAYTKLKEILQEVMSFSEVIKPKDPRDSYSITDEDIN